MLKKNSIFILISIINIAFKILIIINKINNRLCPIIKRKIWSLFLSLQSTLLELINYSLIMDISWRRRWSTSRLLIETKARTQSVLWSSWDHPEATFSQLNLNEIGRTWGTVTAFKCGNTFLTVDNESNTILYFVFKTLIHEKEEKKVNSAFSITHTTLHDKIELTITMWTLHTFNGEFR